MLIKNSKWIRVYKAILQEISFPLVTLMLLLGFLFLFKVSPAKDAQLYFKVCLGLVILTGLLLFLTVIFSLPSEVSRVLREYAVRDRWLKRLKLYKEKGIKNSAILTKVKELINRELDIPIDEIKNETKLTDLGMSSLDKVELVLATEEEFAIEIPEEFESTLQTSVDFALFVESQLEKHKR